MITVWPTPLPDECFYSLIARFSTLLGTPSPRRLGEMVFGSPCPRAVIEWPRHFNRLVARLTPDFGWTVDELRQRLTFWPYYAPFWPANRVRAIADAMAGDAPGLEMQRGGPAGRVKRPPFLRGCAQCIRADRQQYHTAYWHRVHQLPGVMVCPQHRVPLVSTAIPMRNSSATLRYVDLDRVRRSELKFPDVEISSAWQQVATETQWLLDHPVTISESPAWWLARLRAFAIQMGWGRGTSQIATGSLQSALIQRYGATHLTRVGLSVSGTDTWVARLYHSRVRTPDPLSVLLMLGVLGKTAADLFNQAGPRMDAPSMEWATSWPCPNASVVHHQQSVPLRLQGESHSPSVWRCRECGLQFRSTQCPPVRRHVLAWGPAWESALRTTVGDPRMTLRATARRLGVDSNTVKRQMARLGVAREDWMASPPPRAQSFADCRQRHREQWLKLRDRYPDAGRAILRRRNPQLLRWLRQHDAAWLAAHLPTRQQSVSHTARIDWAARDQALRQRAQQVVERLRAQESVVRLTRTAIGREIQALGLLASHPNQLPELNAYLDTVVESREQYAVRRIEWAIWRTKALGQTPTKWQIARVAGIRPELMKLLEPFPECNR